MFSATPTPTRNAFESLAKPNATYPNRRVIQDDLDPKMRSNYQPPIEEHHRHPAKAVDLNSSHPHRLAQLLHHQEQLGHQQLHQPAPTGVAAASVPVAPVVGGPAAPPPLPPVITIGSNPGSVRSVASGESDTPTTAGAQRDRQNLVATATRNQQRKRQRV